MEIKYVDGDATKPIGAGPKLIAHVCNDIGGWGRGFVLASSQRWPEPERRYREWHRGAEPHPFELGEVQFVEVGAELWVANIIGQHDIRWRENKPPVRYEAIRAGLAKVAVFAQANRASV